MRRQGPQARVGHGATLIAPVAVCVVEMERLPARLAVPPSSCGRMHRSVLVVARRARRPIGVAVLPSTSPDGVVDGARIAEALEAQVRVPDNVLPPAKGPEVDVSVIVTTCRNPGQLERCLASILASDYRRFEVIVVENRPGSGVTRRLLESRFTCDGRMRYAEEPMPGLARARNAGAARASGQVFAFVDDDVVVEPTWLSHVVGGFRNDDVACVTGLVLPLRLDTRAQVMLEQFARFGKGFTTRRFQLPESSRDLPLLPYTAGMVGTGANTAIRASVLRDIGGFDPVLGTGTPACGGEDLDLYMRLLDAGRVIVYEPAAVIWHEHPATLRALRRQAFRYGVGLSATLSKRVVRGPNRRGLIRKAPAGLRYAARLRSTETGDGYAWVLSALELAGFVLGPPAYGASVASSRSRGGT